MKLEPSKPKAESRPTYAHVRENRISNKKHTRDSSSARLIALKLVDSQASAAITSRGTSKKEVRLVYGPDVYATSQFSASSTALCTWEYPIYDTTHASTSGVLSNICQDVPGYLRPNPLISSM
jgi:hypothetical protein